jgi:choice-of-anchor B domain-containing protein
MKNFTIQVLYIFLLISPIQIAQNVELLGTLNPYPGSAYTDIWGYAANGREYAFLGATGGTSIIDVTDPSNPAEIVFIPGPFASPYEWRDFKTHSHYLYITSEGIGSGAGLQIVDLSQLPNTATLVNTYNQTFTSAHNLYIADGFAYVVGANPGSGIHILSLANPINPVEVSYYGASSYVHDVFVWNDTAYVSAGNFNPQDNVYALVDLTNKSNPQLISKSIPLPNTYAHSGWLTEDKRYFIACEEFNVRDITVWDLQDRSTWNLVVASWQMAGSSPVHNVFVLGDYAHIAYYKDGYVVLDISDPTNPQFAGQYDTYPGTGGGTYNGAWGVYPYLPSGITLVSDMATGLYICKFNPPTSGVGNDGQLPENFSLNQNYPNPFNPTTRIRFQISDIGFVNLKVFDILGNEIATLVNEEKSAGSYEVSFNGSGLPSGIYFARLTTGNQSAIIKMSLMK